MFGPFGWSFIIYAELPTTASTDGCITVGTDGACHVEANVNDGFDYSLQPGGKNFTSRSAQFYRMEQQFGKLDWTCTSQPSALDPN